MAMTVQGSDRIPDEALPVAQLAARMRLADGYEAIPGEGDRLRLLLAAAIATVERRSGRVTIARDVTVAGERGEGRRIALPVAPVQMLRVIEMAGGGGPVTVGGTLDTQGGIVLSDGVRQGVPLRIVVRAGYGDWEMVPGELRQAVLMLAEALDTGEPVGAAVDALIAPFRNVRIGGRR